MNFLRCIFFFGWMISMTGCAFTNITSLRDPSFATIKFRKVLVVSPFANLESRTQAEASFCKHFAKYSVECVPSIHVLLPTRTYTSEELLSLLSENMVDGVLLVTLTDAYTTQAYVPASSSSYGQATLTGNTVNYSAHTQQYGGYYISKPRVRYEIRLFDVVTGNTAWIATSFTRGNAFANFDILIGSLADSTVEKLRADGLLK